MSTKISKKTFKELLRKLIQREIEEASTTANVPGYDTPRAFAGKGTKMGVPLDRRDSVASGSGYEKIDEADDHEGKMAKAQLERSMEYAGMIYKMIGNVDTDGDGEVNFPSWVQSYLTKSQDYLQSVYNYLDGKDGLDDKFQKEESVNEAVLTISYQPIFDADKKDKLEKIAKKSGLAIRSRGKQGFTVDGKRANVEKFIKATRGMIEVKESVTEDAKDVARAKKITRDLEKIEGKYRKSMYDLSDRLQADPKNHKLQDELVKSYTKNVTSFMRDMIKITKRMK